MDNSYSVLRLSYSGATNAGFFAVQILALADEKLTKRLAEHKEHLERSVAEKSKKVQEGLL